MRHLAAKVASMKRSIAEAGAPSSLIRSAAILNLTAGALVIVGVIVQIFTATKRLVTPVDVGGALFGGAMGLPADALIWMAAICAVLLVALLRLPGFRLAWIASGGLPMVLGALALWSYPNDYGGNLIISPQRSEVVFMMALGGAFLVVGALLHRYVTVPALSDHRLRRLSVIFRLLAMAGLALLFIALPIAKEIEKRQPPLPPCAHDSKGRQLTLCL